MNLKIFLLVSWCLTLSRASPQNAEYGDISEILSSLGIKDFTIERAPNEITKQKTLVPPEKRETSPSSEVFELISNPNRNKVQTDVNKYQFPTNFVSYINLLNTESVQDNQTNLKNGIQLGDRVSTNQYENLKSTSNQYDKKIDSSNISLDELQTYDRSPPPRYDNWPPPPPPRRDGWRGNNPPPPPYSEDSWQHHRPPPPPPDDPWYSHHPPPPPNHRSDRSPWEDRDYHFGSPDRFDSSLDHQRGPPPDDRGHPSDYYRDPPRGPPPDHRGPPPNHRGPPPDHRGPPPGHHGPPPEHRGPPPHDRGPPPDHLGPPPDHRGPPPDHRGPPPDYRGPPPDHRGPPPDHRAPPPDHQGPPPDHRGPPPGHRDPPPDYRGPPPGHHVPPPDHRGPPPDHRGPPPDHRSPPPDHRGPPPDYRGPPQNRGESKPYFDSTPSLDRRNSVPGRRDSTTDSNSDQFSDYNYLFEQQNKKHINEHIPVAIESRRKPDEILLNRDIEIIDYNNKNKNGEAVPYKIEDEGMKYVSATPPVYQFIPVTPEE